MTCTFSAGELIFQSLLLLLNYQKLCPNPETLPRPRPIYPTTTNLPKSYQKTVSDTVSYFICFVAVQFILTNNHTHLASEFLFCFYMRLLFIAVHFMCKLAKRNYACRLPDNLSSLLSLIHKYTTSKAGF